jgi:hypothetical protein
MSCKLLLLLLLEVAPWPLETRRELLTSVLGKMPGRLVLRSCKYCRTACDWALHIQPTRDSLSGGQYISCQMCWKTDVVYCAYIT